jgi:hypothetical protein
LPEVVGDTGKIVTEFEMTERWIRTIYRALKSHDPEAQKCRVERFSATNQIEKLQQILDEIQFVK